MMRLQNLEGTNHVHVEVVKVQKCCMNKKAHSTQEDDFTLNDDFIIDNQISDYGIPEINDAFF